MIQKFLSDGCGCDLVSGSSSSTFSLESVESYRSQCSELSRTELDMAILGQPCARRCSFPPHHLRQEVLQPAGQLRENGHTPRRHGNMRRLPTNTVSFADTQKAVEFLHTYVEANAILLPGRIPDYKAYGCAAAAIQYDKASGVAAVL